MSVFGELALRRYLLWQLTAREVKARYKQSYLGVGWAVLQPLALMAVFSVVFTYVIPVEVKGVPYPLFLYSGLLTWTLFARSLTSLTDSMVSNANLIRKIYFPRQVLLLSGLASRLVDFGVAFAVYFVLMAVFRVAGVSQVVPTVHVLWALPCVAIVCALALGVCLFTSALQVFRRDLRSVTALLVQVWFFATPIIYPLTRVPERWRWVSVINPMTGAVEGFRNAVLRGVPPNGYLIGVSACMAALLVVLGHAFFRRAERQFADVI
jgi:lipopolysaccharide transport system permease protein